MYYISVFTHYNLIRQKGFQWLLFSHTGLVMARSDHYERCCDATRIGKRVAGKLRIDFRK